MLDGQKQVIGQTFNVTFIGFGVVPKLLLAVLAPKFVEVLKELPPKSAMVQYFIVK